MYYTEEDIQQTCVLIQLEKGDVILKRRLTRLEALERLDPRRKNQSRKEDRLVQLTPIHDRIDTREDYLLSLKSRLYKLKGNKKYIRILYYYIIEGLSTREIGKREGIRQGTILSILREIVDILS